jgi:uncharacterized protein (DUF1800 family)
MVSNQKKIQHLYLRAGFILSPADIAAMAKMDIKEVVKKLFNDSQADTPLQSAKIMSTMPDLKDMTADEKKQYIQEQGREVKDLNMEWVNQMVSTNEVLREKMTLFWHGHFACRSQLSVFDQAMNNGIRQNALGKFSDMLAHISKSPAMLQFLNNQQNRKKSPNENFAREVMELFTMGRGNYTEDDIKNAARAFTGWRFNKQGEFEFHAEQHDDVSKLFLGKSGNYNGDDILNIILEQPATAKFIVKKLYRYFVNDEIDEEKCDFLASKFQTDYDLGKLMYSIFVSDWFYDEKNIGTRIKSPIELIVNLQRAIPLQLNNPQAPLYVEKVLGQVLFQPPNVAGWPGGKDWIDSSSLMFRVSLPGFIFNNTITDVKPKENPDDAERKMMAREEMQEPQIPKKQASLSVTPDWTTYINGFKDVNDENLYSAISEYLIQSPSPQFKEETISKYISKDTRESFIKSLTVSLMSVPEYQMC